MVTLNPRAVQEISIFKHGGRAVVGRARSANFIDRSFPPNLHSQQRRGSCSKNLPNQKLPTLVARAPPRPCPVPEIKCSHLSPFFPSLQLQVADLLHIRKNHKATATVASSNDLATLLRRRQREPNKSCSNLMLTKQDPFEMQIRDANADGGGGLS